MPYIYALRNNINSKVYVGYATIPANRWRKEKAGAFNKLDAQYNTILSRAIRKYGWDSFSKEILEVCDTESIGLDAERKWIASLRSNNPEFGYNMDEGGGLPPNHTGKKRSEETKKKIGDKHRGKIISLEARLKISQANKGKKMSEEAKHHLSCINKGKIILPEVGRKISAAKKGVKFSEEHKAALSAARKKMVETTGWTPPNKGVKGQRTHSAETKAKMSAAHKGKPKSPEHIANATAARKAAALMRKKLDK